MYKKLNDDLAEKLIIFLSGEVLHRQGTPIEKLILDVIKSLTDKDNIY